MKYIIEGGRKLFGEVNILGNKNSLFPCVAAAFLTEEEVIIENVSDIRDCQVLMQILTDLGVKVKKEGQTLYIKASEIKKTTLPDALVTKLRGAVVLAGAILSRRKKVSFHHPGGDIIGKRSIDAHLDGFKKLGANVKRNDLKYTVEYGIFGNNENVTIFLDEASVTAAENLILAASLGKRQIIIKNSPKEPHVQDLCNMLNLMGAKISGVGTDTLIIQGVDKLKGVKFRLGVDYIEVGTYIIATAVCGGRVGIKGLDNTDLEPILSPLRKFGIKMERVDNTIVVTDSSLKSVPKITTNIWPGFPTDLMSAAIVLSTQSKGVTLCHDWMYESRMFFVDKLIGMGAQISLADPHRVFVYGLTKLKARELETPDIRAGMALVLAALTAKGKSVINQAELVERGYEDVVGKLKGLGVVVKKVES